MVYTVITFAPVQGFIEKSRKLRDLYGSSFLLSYLARAILNSAERYGCEVISPALIDVTQGTPNQIIIEGNFPEDIAQKAFNYAWEMVVKTCREWIEKNLTGYPYHWEREWKAWANYTWEFFWEQGDSIGEARTKLSEKKRSRNWVGINWHGESSTLSGADAIAWYGMTEIHPINSSMRDQGERIKEFYAQLSDKLSESILAPNERLNIPELIKRLITLPDIKTRLEQQDPNLPKIEFPSSFKKISRKKDEPKKDESEKDKPEKDEPDENRYTGWFQGDGDSIGTYLQEQVKKEQNEAKALNDFSSQMLKWGQELPDKLNDEARIIYAEGRIIYAGGDDFLGVLYRNSPEPELTLQECLKWFSRFHKIWNLHGLPLTVSVGFVWAASGVPQRDILQHCREAEKSAKNQGRDRLAVRILFNSGNYLEWVCPWWFLEDLMLSYKDRTGGQNWTHFYNDIAVLESRHAFDNSESDLALGLFEIYFEKVKCKLSQDHKWDREKLSGIIGNQPLTEKNTHKNLNQWIINLSKIGIHLCSNT